MAIYLLVKTVQPVHMHQDRFNSGLVTALNSPLLLLAILARLTNSDVIISVRWLCVKQALGGGCSFT